MAEGSNSIDVRKAEWFCKRVGFWEHEVVGLSPLAPIIFLKIRYLQSPLFPSYYLARILYWHNELIYP